MSTRREKFKGIFQEKSKKDLKDKVSSISSNPFLTHFQDVFSSLLKKDSISNHFCQMDVSLYSGDNASESLLLRMNNGRIEYLESLKRSLELSVLDGNFTEFLIISNMIKKNIPQFCFHYFLPGTQKTLLHVAIEKNNLDIVKSMIERLNFPINIRSVDFNDNKNHGMTPLHASLIFNQSVSSIHNERRKRKRKKMKKKKILNPITTYLIQKGSSLSITYRGISAQKLLTLKEKVRTYEYCDHSQDKERKEILKLFNWIQKKKKAGFLINIGTLRKIRSIVNKNKNKNKNQKERRTEKKEEKMIQTEKEEEERNQQLQLIEELKKKNKTLQRILDVALENLNNKVLKTEKNPMLETLVKVGKEELQKPINVALPPPHSSSSLKVTVIQEEKEEKEEKVSEPERVYEEEDEEMKYYQKKSKEILRHLRASTVKSKNLEFLKKMKGMTDENVNNWSSEEFQNRVWKSKEYETISKKIKDLEEKNRKEEEKILEKFKKTCEEYDEHSIPNTSSSKNRKKNYDDIMISSIYSIQKQLNNEIKEENDDFELL